MMWKCEMCAPFSPCIMNTCGEKPQCLNTHLHQGFSKWVHVESVKKNWVVDI